MPPVHKIIWFHGATFTKKYSYVDIYKVLLIFVFCIYGACQTTLPPPQNLQIANLKNDYDLRKILDFLSV
jgi:hypothetical protein